MLFEDKIIQIASELFSTAADNSVILGIGDDAAVLQVDDKKLVVTTDIMIENTHFRSDIIDPYSLGWKSCAVNLSDIAAMAAKPVAGFVSLGIKEPDEDYIKSILQGMQDISSKYNSMILGGDTVSSKAGLVINITQLGILEGSYIPLRKNAKKDDLIIATNTLGDSLAGLEALFELGFDKAKEKYPYLVERHLRPVPQIESAIKAVSTNKVNAMMDLSDGLSADIKKLCLSAGLGAEIYLDNLPCSKSLVKYSQDKAKKAQIYAAQGGEDYELLITCAKANVDEIIELIETTGSSACVIGKMTDADKIVLIDNNGIKQHLPDSWSHFE